MSQYLTVWAGVNFVLFALLFILAAQAFRRSARGPLRQVTIVLLLVSGTFLVGSLQRLGLQAERAGLIDSWWGAFFLEDYQIGLSLIGTVTASYALIRLRSAVGRLIGGERMVSVLTERVPLHASVSDWGLTARELQVLEAIVGGDTSDEQLADVLFVAPSTAATHVRNILRKTGLSSRMDLMLVGSTELPKRGDQGTE